MKKGKKKALTAATGAAVIGVAAAALVNGSKLESMFDPGKFEKFENRYKSEDYDYVAGNGEDMDLADQDKKSKNNSGGDDKQLLKLNKQQENDTLSSDVNLVDENTGSQEENPRENQNSDQETITISNSQDVDLPAENRNNNTTIEIPERNTTGTGNSSGKNNSGNNGGSDGTNPLATPTVTRTPRAENTPVPTDKPDATATPSPTQAVEPTAIPGPTQAPAPTSTPVPTESPVPTSVPQPTEEPIIPSPTAEPEPAVTVTPVPTVTSAPTQTPASTPAPTLTPTPISDDDKALLPDAPVVTEYGTLLSISASLSRTEYAFGDTFDAKNATVTGKFLTSDGKTVTKELTYGGRNGYSVSFATEVSGNQVAIFSYKGMYATVRYKVMNNRVDVNYMAVYSADDQYYLSVFPGTPLKDILGDAYDKVVALVSMPNNYAKTGNIINLTEVHSRMIAYLGNREMTDAFAATVGGNYNTVVSLKEKDGYLTNMLEGMRYVKSGELMDDRSYTVYPVKDWDAITRSVIDVVSRVPDGYKIRRVTENDDDMLNYRGQQVLEAYTGTDKAVTVPMGTTQIKLKAEAPTVQTMKIPQSVTEIDTATLGKYLPSLRNYEYEDTDVTYLNYTIEDGILYSKDGKTLLSVPAGRKEVTVPANVKKLGEGCFAGLSRDTVITFKGDTPPSVSGNTGCECHVVTEKSDHDSICKAYMFAFGEECADISFDTADGRENPYKYVSDGPVLVNREDPSRLEAVSPSLKGKYSSTDEITEIGGGAFAACEWLTEIDLEENVVSIDNGGLILPDSVASVTLQGNEVEIRSALFGSPEDGAEVPSVRVCVPEEAYDHYLNKWTEILDPVYGEGTAKKLLKSEKKQYLYENGAKYEVIHEQGKETYILDRVYRGDTTSFQVKDGTTQILANAFAGCENLEFVLIPDSVETIGDGIFKDCTALEMAALGKKGLLDGVETGIPEDAEILTAGVDFDSFTWDDGILYGSTEEEYTLLNVPTDCTAEICIKQKTVAVYQYAMRDCQSYKSFIFTDELSLQSLGDYCFENCNTLGTFNAQECTNLKTIGKGAFSGCSSLVEVKLPDGFENIEEETFYNCNVLKNVTAEGLKKIGDRAFKNCMLLESPGNLEAMESLGNEAFFNCRRLTSMVLPETLTSMGDSCFQNCVALVSMEINGDLPRISRYCFYGCRLLSKITFNSPSIRVIGVRAFANCSSLDKIDLTGLTSLTAIGERAFEGCNMLNIAKFPESLKELPDMCFEDCEDLSIVQLKGEDVKGLGDHVFGTTLPVFLHIWVEEDKMEDYISAYTSLLDPVYGEGTAGNVLGVINENAEIIKGMLFENTEEGKVLKNAPKNIEGELTIPPETVRIEDDAFAGCEKLTDLVIAPDTAISLGDRCFKGCTGIKTLIINGVISQWGDETFMDCTGLNSIMIGRNNNKVIERIGRRAFMNCTGLDSDYSVQIHYAVRAFGEECFAGCSNLSNVAVSSLFVPNLNVIEDGVFKGCVSLRAFLTSKYTGLTSIGAYAFEDCDSLKQPAVPAKVTSIGEGCFMNCDNIMYVSFYGAVEEYPKECFKNCPKLIRTGGTATAFAALKRIGDGAYSGCTSLTASTSWNLGKYTNLEKIGDRAFENCTKLTSSEINPGVTRIGDDAFDGCTAMNILYIKAETPPSVGNITLANMASDFGIRVLDSAEDEDRIYKAYLEALSKVLGAKDAYNILDSISDGAKDRIPEPVSEITPEITAEVTPEPSEIPEVTPVISKVPENTMEGSHNTTADTSKEQPAGQDVHITGNIVGIVRTPAGDTPEIHEASSWEGWEADMQTEETTR